MFPFFSCPSYLNIRHYAHKHSHHAHIHSHIYTHIHQTPIAPQDLEILDVPPPSTNLSSIVATLTNPTAAAAAAASLEVQNTDKPVIPKKRPVAWEDLESLGGSDKKWIARVFPALIDSSLSQYDTASRYSYLSSHLSHLSFLAHLTLRITSNYTSRTKNYLGGDIKGITKS